MLGEKSLPNEPPPYAGLLVALTQRAGVRGDLGDARAVLTRGDTLAALLRLARELGVEGLVLTTLKKTKLVDPLPPETAQELSARLQQLGREAMLWDLERDRVIHVLARHGVTPVLLKGSALRESIYSDPIERSMGDLDFLVAPDELDRSVAALRQAGYVPDREEWIEKYRQHHFHQVMNHPRGFIVELHWALTDPGSRVPLDEKEFNRRATISDRGMNVPVRVPSPEDMLLHTVSQNEDDAFGLLRRIVDIDRIVASSPNVDWDYLVRAARAARLDLVLGVSLRAAQLLLHTDVPARLSRGADLPALARMHLAMMDPISWMLSLPSERRAVAFEAIRLWCAGTWSARAAKAAETLRGESLAMVFAGEKPQRGRLGIADGGLVRMTKLGAYHLLMYWRSGLALASASGRRRLRFWA
jgi:hypothetical protein